MNDVYRYIAVLSALFALYAYDHDRILWHYLLVTSMLNAFIAWGRRRTIEELLALMGTLMAFIALSVVQRIYYIPRNHILTYDYATIQLYAHIFALLHVIQCIIE
jgi:hypothetical protein